jgi:hypothetical protein
MFENSTRRFPVVRYIKDKPSHFLDTRGRRVWLAAATRERGVHGKREGAKWSGRE